MASRTASRALASSIKQLAAPAVQRRTFVAVAGAAKRAAPKAAAAVPAQQRRGVKTIDFAGTKEKVYGTSSMIVQLNGQRLTLAQSVPTGRPRSSL